MHASITVPWADGHHTFRLGLKEIEELEEKADLSIFLLTEFLHPTRRQARLRAIMEVLRLGLIGGGKNAVEALKLVERYVDEKRLDESRDVAYAVCLAALARIHPDKLKETKTKPKKKRT